MTWADGFYILYDYLATGEVTKIRENGATSGAGVLVTYTYDALGHRSQVVRGNGTTTTYTPDPIGRLSQLIQNLAGTTNDLTASFTYNPAGQIASTTRSNDLYAWIDAVNVNRTYTTNSLNQYSAATGVTFGYDGRGNLTSSGGTSYGYTSENLLKNGPGVTLVYDPMLRLYQTTRGSTVTRFQYSGRALVAEYNSAGTMLRRYVNGAGADEPIVWYEGAGTTDRRWLHADERGSVIAITNASGTVLGINTYDEYGIPGAGNLGRFQYTGQTWLPELGMYYYKARVYSPTLGRFMQTDPIGYADGMNWYAYAGSDPLNGTDPSGTFGLFGGCPAGSHCLSTNPASANANDWYSHQGRGEGSAGSSSSGYVGGPLNGSQTCNNCLDARDASVEQIRSSILYHQGYYLNGQWISVNPFHLTGGMTLGRLLLIATLPVGIGEFGLAAEGATATRVFWSGGEAAKTAASEWAVMNGGTTLEMTSGGRALEAVTADLDWLLEARPMWVDASKSFAASAAGDVHVFQGAYISTESIWATTEYRALLQNPNVGNIIYHGVGW